MKKMLVTDIGKRTNMSRKVTNIMKKQKLGQVRKIVKNENNSTWGQEAHAKVSSRFIELFIESAHIQPPEGQSSGGQVACLTSVLLSDISENSGEKTAVIIVLHYPLQN